MLHLVWETSGRLGVEYDTRNKRLPKRDYKTLKLYHHHHYIVFLFNSSLDLPFMAYSLETGVLRRTTVN